MDVKMLDLRRYAIDQRREIKFTDPATGNVCKVNRQGNLNILSEDKDLRMEAVLAAAQTFEMDVDGKPQSLTREEMVKAMARAQKARGVAASDHDDDE